MALIKCPNCNNDVSDTANTCPNCDYDIKSYVSSKQQEKQDKTKRIIAIVAVIVMLASVVAVILIINRNAKIKEYIEDAGRVSEAYEYIMANPDPSDINIKLKKDAEESIFELTIKGLCYDYDDFKDEERVMNAISYYITPSMIKYYKKIYPEWNTDYADDDLLDVILGY